MTRYKFEGPKSSLLAFFLKFQGKYRMAYFSECSGKKGSCVFLDIPEPASQVYFLAEKNIPLPSDAKRVARALRMVHTIVIP